LLFEARIEPQEHLDVARQNFLGHREFTLSNLRYPSSLGDGASVFSACAIVAIEKYLLRDLLRDRVISNQRLIRDH
jgi:hypothetical protein